MILRSHHQVPTRGSQLTAAREQTPAVPLAGCISSRPGRIHGWRGCASVVVAVVLLALFGVAHAAQLTLSWSDASTNEDGFKVERATGTTGAYGQLGTVAAGTSGYVDATVTAGTTYCYRVRAYNTAGDSAYSNAACAVPASATLYTVTVGKAGAGSGTVASSPSAINCGSTCTASVANGTSLALSATPATGSTFSGWSGACTGTGTCALVVDGAKNLTATFAVSAPTTYALSLTKSGTGTGTVTSSPAGVNCGAICSYSFTSGTSVTLTAAASTGSTFAGWGGACTGTGTCTVSMTAALSATATFTAQTYALTVTKNGTGSGTVASSPTGVNCGSTCSAMCSYNTSVTLTATPASGSTFTGWGGACSGTGTCTVAINAATSVTANFVLGTYTLTVGKAGMGSGTVTSSPAGINCGATCSASVNLGTSVTLTATPATGSTFTGWSGACTGAGACTVTMGASQNVTATFAVQNYALTVTKAGTGSGTVTSNPTGINCGTTCTTNYNYNTAVTLTAAAPTGSTFTGWSGACTGTGNCTVAMSAARAVTATFANAALPSVYSLGVTKHGTGTGIVASNPAGVNCGTTCSAIFTSGTVVTLEAMPDAGSTFAGWGGPCSGAVSCTVSLGQAQNVTATFSLQSATLTVSKIGMGTGTVSSSPAGINCGSACNAAFSGGTAVTLKATPSKRSVFAGWSGACTGTGSCTVTLTQSKSVTASFRRKGR
jgi:hypothetical protein